MNTSAHLVIVGSDADAELVWAQERLEELERKWSRFLPDSELNAINDAAGSPTIVSRDTALAVATAVDGWARSTGLYDPTTADAVVAAGYRTSWPFRTSTAEPAAPAPGCLDIHADPLTGLVEVPAGVRLDLGGIGKGLAADVVADELLARGAKGALVNLGGDLRIRGDAPHPAGWQIDVVPRGANAAEPLPIAIGDGAVATSGTLRRRWFTEQGERHHVIDPRTGEPSRSDVVTASIIGASGAQCEVLAKAVIVGGTDAADLVLATGATGVLTTFKGEIVRLPGFDRFEIGVAA